MELFCFRQFSARRWDLKRNTNSYGIHIKLQESWVPGLELAPSAPFTISKNSGRGEASLTYIYGPEANLMYLTDRCRFLNCSVRGGGGVWRDSYPPYCPYTYTLDVHKTKFRTYKEPSLNGPWYFLIHKITNVPVFLIGAGGRKTISGAVWRPFKRPLLWISPHPNPYVPPHINNRYINSYTILYIRVLPPLVQCTSIPPSTRSFSAQYFLIHLSLCRDSLAAL